MKIIDFGLSKQIDTGNLTKTYCGTSEYLAPEMITQTGHNFAIDWWALGILIYEMTIGITPFFTKNKNLLFTRIQRANVIFPEKTKYNLSFSDEFEDIVQKLLEKDWEKRLGTSGGFQDILKHPWFKDIDINQIETMQMEPPIKPNCNEGPMTLNHLN